MKCLVFMCAAFVCASAMGGEDLDSLLEKTEKLEQKQVKGFVYRQQSTILPPDEMPPPKGSDSSDSSGPSAMRGSGTAAGLNGLSSVTSDLGVSAGGSGSTETPRYRGPGQYVSYREFATEMRAIDKKMVEFEVNQKKMTEILKNIHGNNERVVDGVNVAMKLIEVIGAVMAAVIAVASALIAYARTKRARP